jgi:hypothetical protein
MKPLNDFECAAISGGVSPAWPDIPTTEPIPPHYFELERKPRMPIEDLPILDNEEQIAA